MRGARLPNTVRGVSPCVDCAERHTACHDNCPKYHDWKAEVEKIKEAKKTYLEDRQQAYEEQKRRNRWGRKTS